MIKGLNFITPKMIPPGFTDLKGLEKRETVFGINFNGISRAYPKSKIRNLTHFIDHYSNKALDLNYDEHSDYLTAVDHISQKRIIVEKHWWLGWKEFHPESEIWKKRTHRVDGLTSDSL